MLRLVPALRISALVAAALFASRPALAQRFGNDADGADQCRPIWREFGRFISDDPPAVYCEVRELGTLPRRGESRIAIDGGENGGVRVTGGKRSEARVRLVVQAQARTVGEARELAKRVTVDLNESPLRAEGTGNRGGWRHSQASAYIVVDSPEKANLSLTVHNGPLEVEGVSGQMELRTTNGPIDLHDVGGDVRARAQNGPISVELAGSQWNGEGLDAQAQNGPVTLSVPRDFGAELEIGTRNGPIDVDFPLTLRRLSGRTISTTLGKGGPRVRAVTENGPMTMRVSR